MAEKNNEIKAMIKKLETAVLSLSSGSKDQLKINRELLKVISLLNAGFAKNKTDAQDLIDQVSKGLSLTDEEAGKWAKTRGATSKDLESIKLKFKQIEASHGRLNDSAEDFNDTLGEITDSLDDEIDLTKNLFKTYKEINEILKKSKDVVGKIGNGTISVDTAMEQILKKKGTLSTMFDDMFSSTQLADEMLGKLQQDSESLIDAIHGMGGSIELNFVPNSAELNRALNDMHKSVQLDNDARLAGLYQYFSENEELQRKMGMKLASEKTGGAIEFDISTGTLRTAMGELTDGTKEYQKAYEKLQGIHIDTNGAQSLQDIFVSIGALINKNVQRTADEDKLLDSLVQKLDLGSQLITKQVIQRQIDLQVLQSTLRLEANRNSQIQKYTKHLQFAENAIIEMGSGFDTLNSMIPMGIGNLLGLNKVSYQLMEGHKVGAKAFVDVIAAGGTPAKAMAGYLKSFGPILKLALNPLTLIIAGFALAYKFVEGMVDKYKTMSKEMGVSLLQAKKLNDANLDILTSQRNQFNTMQDIEEAQKAMIGDSGKVFDLTTKGNREIALSAIEMGKAFGYGTESAIKMQKMFENLGASDDLASNLQANLGLISEMVGLSPQIISQDLLDASEEVYTYFAGMPEKAAKAAIEVRKMGFSLKQAGSIAQKMLDLGGFMEDMYELRAMTGPSGIDFSKAFDLGLTGDIAGMTKEIMNQIGTTADLNKMDYLTRMKIAKTLGMSSEELGKSVMLHEKMSKLDAKDAAYAEANIDRIGDISKMSKDQIKDRLAQLQSTDRMGVAWEKIKATFVKALLPLVETFGNILEGLGPVLNLLIPILEGILWPFNQLIKLVRLISPILKPVGQILMGFLSPIESILEKITGIKNAFGETGNIIKVIAAGFSSWFILKKILGYVGLMKSGVGEVGASSGLIGKIFGGIIPMFGKIVKGILSHLPIVGIFFQKMFKNVEKQSEKTSSKISSDGKRSFGRMAGMAGGIFAAMNSKVIFGGIQSIAAKAFSKIGITGAESMLGIEPAAVDAFGNVKESGIGAMSAVGLIGSSLMTEYLQYGVEKFFQKKFEKTFEGKTDSIVKKAAKKFGKIGEVGGKMLDPLTTKASSVFDKILNTAQQKFPKISEIFSKSFSTVSDKLGKGKGLIGKLFGKSEPADLIGNVTKKVDEVPGKLIENKPADLIQSVTNETKAEVKEPKGLKKTTSIFEKVKKTFQTGFSVIADAIKQVSKMIKTVLTDLVQFVSSSLKTLSSGVGTAIKNILKGIGDGLGSFKASALKGAATLLVLSGALWVTSKAVQNFTNVKWNDLAKAGAALGGLAIVALALGSASVQMIIGAAAIAILGASLIPTAIALKMFNDVDWSSLAKAGVALIGLSLAALAVGTIMMSGVGAVAILAGAAAFAILGASLLPLAFAMQIFAKGANAMIPVFEKIGNAINGVITSIGNAISVVIKAMGTAFVQISGSIQSLATIDAKKLFAVAAGIYAVGSALVAFTAMNIGSAFAGTFEKIFGGGPIEKLKSLAAMADPLSKVADSISIMSSSLLVFAETLQNLSLDNLDVFKEISKLEPEKLNPLKAQITGVSAPNSDDEIPSENGANLNPRPAFQRSKFKPSPPPRESTAQNVMVRDLKQIQKEEPEEDAYGYGKKQGAFGGGEMDSKAVVRELRQVQNLLAAILAKNTDVHLDGVKVNNRLKKFNNGIG